MGAWDTAILTNDTALDSLGEVSNRIEEDIRALGEAPTPQRTAELGAAVGLLLVFSPYSFDPDNEMRGVIQQKLAAYHGLLSALGSEAATLLNALAAGDDTPIGEKMKLSPQLAAALYGVQEDGSPSNDEEGAYRPTLFSHPDARAYLARVVERCAQDIETDLEDEEVLEDLSREAVGIGSLGALAVIEPVGLTAERVARWRARVQEGLQSLVEGEAYEDADFDQRFYGNVKAVLVLIEQRIMQSAP